MTNPDPSARCSVALKLSHSMAFDVVIRAAQQDADVGATIAVSMFSRAATATSPRNLLVVAGNWERRLKTEALRVVGLASAPDPAHEGPVRLHSALGYRSPARYEQKLLADP